MALTKLIELEEQVRMLGDERAIALVKQLRALSARGTLTEEAFSTYMRELERNVQTDLSKLSAGDRDLVEELGYVLRRVLRGLRPSFWLRTGRRLIQGRVPAAIDDFGRDEEYIQRMKPVTDFLFNKYWRIQVEGLENVADTGPCLLVANHSGMLPFDGWMIQHAVHELHPSGRPVRFLMEQWFTSLPFLSYTMARLGQVRGSQVNAERLLERGELVGVFPEGVKGIGKSYRDRYHLQRFGRGGTVRLAMKTRAPVVPVAVVGAEETYPVMFTSGFLANVMRVPFFPFTPLFPLLGPLGALPLPSKWHIRFGERIPLGDFSPGAWEDEILVNTLNEDVRQTIQEMVSDLVQRRRSLFFG